MRLIRLFLLCVILLPALYYAATIPVTSIKVPQLSAQEYDLLKTFMEKSETEQNQLQSIRQGVCGTMKQKQIDQYLASPSYKQQQSQCSNIKTTCDDPTVRNQYTSTSIITFEIEFFIENNGGSLATNATNRVAVVLAETNQYYQQVGIQFTSTIHLWGPLKDSSGQEIPKWYTNIQCEPDQSQPCFSYVSILNSIVPNLPQNPRDHWSKPKAIQLLIANIQADSSGIFLLGFAHFPYEANSGIMVQLPQTIVPGDSTLAHELGHTFGLFHVHTGINEINECSDPCYESTASDLTGDLCADTPPFPNVVSVNNLFTQPTCRAPTPQEVPDSCGVRTEWSQLGTVNLMSYSSNECATQFTSCQNKRMRCVAESILLAREGKQPNGVTSLWGSIISVLFVGFFFF